MAADLNQILQETITGHHVVKSFGAEDFESNRFRVAAGKLKTRNLSYVAQQALASPIIEFLGAATIVFLLSIARDQAKTSGMTAGKFTGFVLALVMLYEPVKRLTGIHNIFQQGIGAASAVFSYLDRPRGCHGTYQCTAPGEVREKRCLQQRWFRLSRRAQPAGAGRNQFRSGGGPDCGTGGTERGGARRRSRTWCRASMM